MASPGYVKHASLRLKGHAELTEAWLQDRIKEDPAILCLDDDLVPVGRERTQESGGRLDLLFRNADRTRRYEVEIQLGTTDPSHIIRTIEYWDVERRRYPAYEHVAVLVAEDVTGRFLSVLGLLAGSVPLVVLQVEALVVGDKLILHFAKVLDQRALRTDDEADAETAQADRGYWERLGSVQTVALADQVLAVVNDRRDVKLELKYNKPYIGLSDGTRSRGFVQLLPRKGSLRIDVQVESPEPLMEKLRQAEVEADVRGGRLRFNVTAGEVEKHRPLLAEILRTARDEALGEPPPGASAASRPAPTPRP